MANAQPFSWDPILSCREFWLNYFWLTDDKLFQPKRAIERKHRWRLSAAFRELLRGHSLKLSFAFGYSLVIEFGRRESLFLVQDGKRKQHLLGWVDPHPCNHVFRFDEIKALSKHPTVGPTATSSANVFLLLLGYWGIAREDLPRTGAIGREIARNLRATKLFDQTETAHIVAVFEKAHKSTECQWIVHDRWGWVAESPMSLRSPGSNDIPDGMAFNFREFAKFQAALDA